MSPNYNELVNYCISFRKSGKYADMRISLIRELLQKALKNPDFELANDQIIISSNYPDEVINDVFLSIYGKLPRKIIVATDNSKIVNI